VSENAKRHTGMILLQKHQRKLLTKSQKVDLVGYEGENDRFWVIYSRCGSPVRTEFSRRPDEIITRPNDGDSARESGHTTRHVRMTRHCTCPDFQRIPFGLPCYTRPDSKEYRPDAPHWNTRKTEKNLQRSNFLKSVSEYAYIINW